MADEASAISARLSAFLENLQQNQNKPVTSDGHGQNSKDGPSAKRHKPDVPASAASTTNASKERLTLFGLPGEIRNRIFRFVIGSGGVFTPLQDKLQKGMLVNHQMRREMLSLYFGERIVVFNIHGYGLAPWLRLKKWVVGHGPFLKFITRFGFNFAWPEQKGYYNINVASADDVDVREKIEGKYHNTASRFHETKHYFASSDLLANVQSMVESLTLQLCKDLRRLRNAGLLTADLFLLDVEVYVEELGALRRLWGKGYGA
ncbi:hypothetical protein UCRNP2_7374 [Neofusicoccum parvum UCRNP2]|uniref:Uncharacterized protein n=2 Tax=Neofusicoccum parvum TaxID=310453 RepID=R1GIV7_BOTPV|nr:hypothetical protein UCRNP2_7374 [Neofusicoccum parvum UCRNP2]GME28246.1 hypothetical protein B0A50_07360 [Neofusicoccum parvum]